MRRLPTPDLGGRRADHARQQAGADRPVLGWARGVYHGLRRKHLQAYLDEFASRSLLALALKAKPITYNILIEPEPCE